MKAGGRTNMGEDCIADETQYRFLLRDDLTVHYPTVVSMLKKCQFTQAHMLAKSSDNMVKSWKHLQINGVLFGRQSCITGPRKLLRLYFTRNGTTTVQTLCQLHGFHKKFQTYHTNCYRSR